MPTAAKLIAAVALAAVMFMATLAYIPGLPEGTQTKWYTQIAALVGFICGWFLVGRAPDASIGEAMSAGVKGSAVACFWILMLVAGYVMLRRSMRMMYDGVFDAVLGVFDQFLEFGALIFVPEVLGWLFGGGAMVGLLARLAVRRWK